MTTYISFMCSKGGVGRSTLAEMTANAFHYRTDYRCLLVDLDHKDSLIKFRKEEGKQGKEEGVPLISLDPEDEHYLKALYNLENDYDFIFIDTPRDADRGLGDMIKISDIVIVPLLCSPTSILPAIQFIEDTYKAGPKKMILGIINMSYSKESNKKVRAVMNNLPITVLDSSLSNLNIYREHSSYQDINSDEFNGYFFELKPLVEPFLHFEDPIKQLQKTMRKKETTRIRIDTEIIDEIRSYIQDKGIPSYRPIVEQILSDGIKRLGEQG